MLSNFASTRSVQIATLAGYDDAPSPKLCLHTLRADCNARKELFEQHMMLCLHTLRADCNGRGSASCRRKATFASTRSVQIATAEMHRIAICTFQNVC